MAKPEALIKYYDCLKDSFSKIQDKDKETALINAALRPKIRDELAQNKDILSSYLNYIQVFSLIYEEQFSAICNNVLIRLFEDYDFDFSKTSGVFDKKLHTKDDKDADPALQIHLAIKAIINSKKELADTLVIETRKIFPSVFNEEKEVSFTYFFKNSLVVCSYLRSDRLVSLLTKIVEATTPGYTEDKTHEDVVRAERICDELLDYMYEFYDQLNDHVGKRFTMAFLRTFTHDFVSNQRMNLRLGYYIMYICSKKMEYAKHLIDTLWDNFVDVNKSQSERISSITFASSFIARAKYVNLDVAIDYLSKNFKWCHEFIDKRSTNNRISTDNQSEKNLEYFYALTQSSFYLLSQRYREFYEEDTIARIKELNIDRIISDQTRPLDNCAEDVKEKFQEVASVNFFANPATVLSSSSQVKRRRLDINSNVIQNNWKVPFKPICHELPKRIVPLYRNYYDRRNFTVYRD